MVHSIHKVAVVQKHLEALGGQITLFFLPPYSPDLSADEWVWKPVPEEGQDLLRQLLEGAQCGQSNPLQIVPGAHRLPGNALLDLFLSLGKEIV